jgi:hypothetical protein
MRTESWKHGLALASSLLFLTGNAMAKESPSEETPRAVFFPARGVHAERAPRQHLVGKTALLGNHGGPTITSAKVVLIFWGPSFSNTSSPDYTYAQTLIAYRNQLGTTPEYGVITEYSGILATSLGSGTADWFDTSTPPANVTDANVQAEVNTYLASHTFDASTIYEVVLPSSSYSSFGSSTSCGGPSLAYCAYHSWIGSGSSATKYSIQPYPSCGGCQVAGFSDVQNQEHFLVHETREAVTDSTGSAWYDSGGNEADDECAWSPPPFLGTGGYAYQFEWSNAAGNCISSTSAGSPPPTPSLTVTRDLCYGSNEADWTATSGATAYELWGSSSSTFTSQGLYYSGPDTTYFANVGGTTYFHVRACNANGCSAFSNSGRATYTRGCL